jgi:uncharacterized protein (DUF305 family)
MFDNNGAVSSLSSSPLTDTLSESVASAIPFVADPLTASETALRIPMFTAAGSDATTTPNFLAAGAPAPDEAARFDVRYLQETIDHHQMAIDMAELAVDRVINDDLRSLAQNIIETQTEERETMQTWLKDWYGFEFEPEMNPGEERMLKEMSIMRGAQFEIDFMRQMTMHHMAGINDAVPCTAEAGHVELKELCGNIASAQMREAEQMRQWLRDRYKTGVDMIGVSPDADNNSIPNGSFERGNFTGWSAIGHADIQTVDYGVFPTDGAFQALITTASETVPGIDLEPMLGLKSGTLSTIHSGEISEGSALQLTFNAQAGDTLTFDWNFLTNELESTLVGSNNDFSFAVLQSIGSGQQPLVYELADIHEVPNTSRTMITNESGYQTFSTTIDASGTYTLSVGAVNIGDVLFDSNLLVDNFKLTAA